MPKGQKNKKVYIKIDQYDVEHFNQLVYEEGQPFTWTFNDVDITFIRDEGD